MIDDADIADAFNAIPSQSAGDVAKEVVEQVTAPTQKWGTALDGGFQVLPDLLLRHQRELSLSNAELVVLLHLTMAWWQKDKPPYPRTATIARRMNTSERTVQRALDHLRKAKLLTKTSVKVGDEERRTAFDLTPLANRLKDIAQYDPLAMRRHALRSGGAGVQNQPLAQA